MELQLIQSKIYDIRGRRVMLDFDLAQLYEVETSALKRAVKRNAGRFPEDFMFELSRKEFDDLRCQIGISNRGGTRYMPFAFTEQGVSMLSAILHSSIAVQTSISIMRAFVAMRDYITSSSVTTAQLAEIRTRLELLERNDEENMEAINDLSEDMRREIDNLYNAIGELSVKLPQLNQPRKVIKGFQR